MKSTRLTLFSFVLVTLLLLAAPLTYAKASDSFRPGEINVELAAGVSLTTINARYGTSVLEQIGGTNLYRLRLPAGADVLAVREQMGLDLDIVFAEPNYNYQPPETRQSSQAFVDQSSQAFVDGSAPGVNLYSAFPGNRWAWWSGTSFAAPLVSGEAALLLALNPGLSRSEVRNVITRARIDPNPLNPAYTRKLGQVRIDFLLAVTWR